MAVVIALKRPLAKDFIQDNEKDKALVSLALAVLVIGIGIIELLALII